MFRSIIVPLDGSAFGDYALPFGIALARRNGATLKLLHVHLPHVPGESLEAIPHYQYQHIYEAHSAVDADARRAERDHLWELAERLAGDGIPTTAHLLTGRVADEISRFAGDESDGLIVMTTHGLSGFQRIWLGSVADAVVRHSSTPVLLVRPATATQEPTENVDFRRILVPVDGSPFSSAIIGPVASLAGTEQLQVTFFEVAAQQDDPALSPIWPTGHSKAGTRTEDFRDQLPRQLPENLVLSDAKRVVDRSPALAILKEAESSEYDLIAMATHGRGGAHHLLLGSTADKVMRGTEKPILLFRPHGVAPRAAAPAGEMVVEEVIVEQVVAYK
jgi:nucleotide-binding universal stress UspA family protein